MGTNFAEILASTTNNMICLTCGSLVPQSETELHADWHETLTTQASIMSELLRKHIRKGHES